MFYLRRITAPANTPEHAPTRAFITPDPGAITRIYVFIPAGHAGLTGVKIYQFETQIFPSKHGGSFAGDDTTVDIPEFVPTFALDAEIMIAVHNTDAQLDHDVFVGIGVLPLDVALPTVPLAQLARDMRRVLQRLGLVMEV